MKFLSLIILSLLLCTNIQAQDNAMLSNLDRIDVTVDAEGRIIYQHNILKGQTIYTLARTFGTTSYEVHKLNNISKDDPIALNQIIAVQLPISRIYRVGKLSRSEENEFIPIYYSVKPKENLFRISKVYFSQDIETMQSRNNKSDLNLSPGEQLLVGWIKSDGIPVQNLAKVEVIKESSEDVQFEGMVVVEPVSEQTETLPDDMSTISTLSSDKPEVEIQDEDAPLRYRQTRGIAIWDKKSTNMGSMYVMHHTAKINSEIKLFYATSNRTITAKVVGRIPPGTYPSDVALIITPRVADELGALDSRLLVEMKFAE